MRLSSRLKNGPESKHPSVPGIPVTEKQFALKGTNEMILSNRVD
jgi:hypothetical protein